VKVADSLGSGLTKLGGGEAIGLAASRQGGERAAQSSRLREQVPPRHERCMGDGTDQRSAASPFLPADARLQPAAMSCVRVRGLAHLPPRAIVAVGART
jgi:hypothetical protein